MHSAIELVQNKPLDLNTKPRISGVIATDISRPTR